MGAALALQLPVETNPFLSPKSRPLVVGHRGVPLLHQENTLAGFRRAVALGVDAIELDVRLTRDRRAVVFHDATAYRMTGTRAAISDLTWDELRQLPIRDELRTRRATLRYPQVERIPLLAEVLAEVGRSIAINIELKPRWFGDDVAAVVADEILAAGGGSNVLVTSYDPRKLRDASRADPSLALGYCWCSGVFGGGRRIVDRLLRASGVHAVGADHELVQPETVQRLRGVGQAVGAHVVFPLDGAPTPEREIERLRALELDWIESDDPVRLQRAIA
jgi:glycerophosphoryl diester phosphodiesterase